VLDLTKSQELIMSQMNSKTRYNVRLAIKKGVQIIDDTSEDGIETFIRLMDETSRRQRFYAHDANYFRQLFRSMKNSGIVRIFHAIYNQTVLVSWIVFIFNDQIFYPYGASSALYREVMASNLMMWETIQFGQSMKAKIFDMWGALGPEPNPKDPWLGFHNFKRGYGADLMENFPTYDFVYDPAAYQLFQMANKFRWTYLRTKKALSHK
jgi:lipid II:glycine glycyltransferase (peptidoglycan interpeptide bridge formation enzyme)